MTSFRMQGGWRLWGLALGLFLVTLFGAASVTTPGLRAQESPLATPTALAGPISPLATAAPAVPLAGTALDSPSVMAALVVIGVIVVGGIVWQYRRSRATP